MKKRVAIVQSNYIPWKGYFDLMNMVDEFIFYDDMQYTKRDWRNRNKISTSSGLKWLTIPVSVKGRYLQKINETTISDPGWAKNHWDTIRHVYHKAKFFRNYSQIFEEFYLNCEEIYLSKVNIRLIQIVNNILQIETKLSSSEDFNLIDGKTERLLDLCKQAGGDVYVSGLSAKDYFKENLAESFGIEVEWITYSSYPEYNQVNKPFEHGVSILDLIFNEGPNSYKFMKSFVLRNNLRNVID